MGMLSCCLPFNSSQFFFKIDKHNQTQMAPEMWHDEEDADEDAEQEYSQKVDVYAFAIIMWEALCFAAPWGSVKEKKVRKKVMKGDRPPVHKRYISGAPEGYVDLMKQSWAQKARKRPTFPRIFNQLQAMRIELEQMEEEEEQGETRVSRIEHDDDSKHDDDDDDETKTSTETSAKKDRKRLPSSTPSGLRFWHARSQRDDQYSSVKTGTERTSTTQHKLNSL